MIIHRRIQRIRKQSRIASPTRNLWFLSNESLASQSQIAEKKSLRNDRESIFYDDYIRYKHVNTNFRRVMRECPFVVDWQLSDNC